MGSCIKVLDEEVVKRIAAGEVLQRPVNAVKELLENSLDAGATRIAITVQVPSNSKSSNVTECGLFSISIADNGHGIWHDDLPLLCERHATSKLTSVAGLREVETFGFRGEALASCAQVARVEVVTRRREAGEEVAWQARYLAGKLQGEAEPIAGNVGTTIHVRDLFYANRVRREALLASSDEYQRILQVVQYYAIDRANKCAFSLTKRTGNKADVQTDSQMSHVAVIGSIFGSEIGAALMPFKAERRDDLGLESIEGWATRTTFHGLKSPTVIIFLNGRLIEHAALRRAMLQAFAAHLPTSPPAHPFIYVSLRVRGSRVDVNVHPTKRQVFFLDEAEIIAHLLAGLDEQILRFQYESQSMRSVIIKGKSSSVGEKDAAILYPSQRVLTDSRNTRIDSFLYHSSQSSSQGDEKIPNWSPLLKRTKVEESKLRQIENKSDSEKIEKGERIEKVGKVERIEKQVETIETKSNVIPPIAPLASMASIESTQQPRIHSTIQTPQSTIQTIQSTIQDPQTSQSHILNLLKLTNSQISSLLRQSIVVGIIDTQWSLLQSGTSLVLAETPRLAFELFFSLLVFQSKGADSSLALEGECQLEDCFEGQTEVIQAARQVLLQRQHVLKDSLGIHLHPESASLLRLPALIPGHRVPPVELCRTFLARLALIEDDAEGLIMSAASELSTLYSQIPSNYWPDWPEYLTHCLLPALKDSRAHYTLNDSFATGREASNPPLQIISNTETLYKSFERC